MEKSKDEINSCAGSGSTCVACLRDQRHFLAFEKETKYFVKAAARIEHEKRQLKLF